MNLKKTTDNNLNIEQINNKIKASIIKQIILILIISIILLIILPPFHLNEDKYLLCLSWIGNLTFIISIYLYYKATDSLICPYIMFFCSFFCFQFGQWFLYSLGIKYEYVHLGFYATLWDNNSKILLNGTAMIILSIAVFNLGALCSLTKTGAKKSFLDSFNMSHVGNKAIKLSGWILFCLTSVPTFYNKIKEMRISLKYGYSGIYAQLNNEQSIIGAISILFIPSCILLIIGYKKNKTIKNLIQLVMLLFAFIGLVGGGRTEGISILLVLILYNVILSKKINRKKFFKIVISVIVVMTLVATFADFREVENKDSHKFVSTLIETISSKNPMVSAVGEMGWSMGTIFMTMKIVPKYIEYDYGKSYLASLSRFIPNSIDPSGTISRWHSKSSRIASLVTNFNNSTFGMDSTLIGESYYNFGYLGIMWILFMGLIIGKILGYRSKLNIVDNGLNLYIKLAGLYSIFSLPRRQCGYLVNQIAYVIVLVVLMVMIIKYYLYTKSK